jgi:hypothetical protein
VAAINQHENNERREQNMQTAFTFGKKIVFKDLD